MLKICLVLVALMVNFPIHAGDYSTQNDITISLAQLKSINTDLLSIKTDQEINSLIDKRVQVLNQLVGQLKLTLITKIALPNTGNKIAILESRININEKKNNNAAVKRDQMQLAKHQIDRATLDYLQFLITSSKNYKSIDFISNKTQQLLDTSTAIKQKLTFEESLDDSVVSRDLKQNHQQFLQAINTYQDILNHILINPRKIASVHWFQEFSLLSAISYINQFDMVQTFNYKLANFALDTGGILISIVIFCLVYFSYPFVFRCTSWFVENYVIAKGSEQQELIYHDIRKPVRMLLVFFGLNLSAYSLFYKTNYREFLSSFSFIIYSLIIIWIIYKVIDSIVLVQIQKLSKSNIELRKELFNLGVQAVKVLIAIIVLAFGLNNFGISITAIASTLGIGGLAFALAAKDTLSNLLGGITILFDNILRLGDWIKVDKFEGTVAEIGLRSVTIRTFDNALITIPNSIVSVSGVVNWDRRSLGRRIKMYIRISYKSDMENVQKCLIDIRQMLFDHPDIANQQPETVGSKRTFKFASHKDTQGIMSTQLVYLDRYNDYSIDILVYCFTKTVQWEEWLTVKEDVLFKISKLLQTNKLEFAYHNEINIDQTKNSRSKE